MASLPSLSGGAGRIAALTLAGLLVITTAVVFLRSGSEDATLTANFPRTVSIYEGSAVRILGVPVGQVDTVTPAGTTVEVEMSYDPEIDVPADAKAVIVAPSVVGDRYVQLTPAYTSGEKLADGATLDMSDTAVPLELDQIYQYLDDLAVGLGPNGANKEGALTRLLETTADNFGGQGEKFNETVRNLSRFTTTLDNNKEALFSTATEIERFVKALADNDQTVRDFNDSLASASTVLEGEREELAAALRNLGVAMEAVSGFVNENKDALSRNIKGLVGVTDVLVKQRAALEEVLSAAPTALSNLFHTYNPSTGTLDTRTNLSANITELETDPVGALCTLIQPLGPAGNTCDQLEGALGDLDLGAATRGLGAAGGGGGGGGGGGLLDGIAPRAGAGTTNASTPVSKTVIEIEPIDTSLAGLVEVSR
jgi:phospholipid/cholesterol/gamma-HCH transport system substrate-binding protein